MIGPMTLRSWRRVVSKLDHQPTRQRERELLDSHLALYQKLDQVRAIAEKAAALRPWVDNEGPTVDAAGAANEVGNDILDVLGIKEDQNAM
ncbi:hypothetical protein SEA_TELAVIV_91 [Mycobacterium phage TelAviv]|nr:hypothetical protein PBI_DYLAN_93 [Mycobacterium phage Dylan]YP_009014461.1 hypothetical protein CL96_gp098 [Mycobacterium phage Firecracker]AII28334.1 hypothetical protein PBI_YUNGJAMAL_95 [Mycobacterium phage YungJamal]ALA48935.1 hypothetical protein ZAKHE101_93 [Mycobacterium phage Zakhe101]ATW60577.1 hypothetical protein SEA_FAMILTON_95 [Mycobacterium phage Familton]AVI04124.1 hypothetical protein SEA_JANGDYNASTY_93 [Mycobacterium phage JangDynasty]AVP42748.1 hypothetical protein SEA_S